MNPAYAGNPPFSGNRRSDERSFPEGLNLLTIMLP